MARSNKLLVWGLIAAGASCGLCGLGTLAIMALGLSTDDEGAGTGSAVAPQREAAQRGAPGGFSFESPQGWTSSGQGRFLGVVKEAPRSRASS